MARIFNFSPGPAILPEPVLDKAAAAVRELGGSGMSILEVSHRGKEYAAIHREAGERLARLLGCQKTHKIVFLQGGASLQFHMIPSNLLPAGSSADYVVTGSWAKKALAEAKRIGNARAAASTEADGFRRLPAAAEIDGDPKAAYLHYTSNNTIFGTQWPAPPDAGDVPLVLDASSDILSRTYDFASHGLVYAGAQKNLGPAGVTVVAIREDLLHRSPAGLPPVLSYAVQAEKDSLYNTPPVFAVFVVNLVLEWIEDSGGLEKLGARNRRKADALYSAIDAGGFYRGTAEAGSRSAMNVTFRLPTEDLEKRFIEEATAAGLAGLKGHRSVGGCRASIYNAFPEEGVAALVDFMKEFSRKNG